MIPIEKKKTYISVQTLAITNASQSAQNLIYNQIKTRMIANKYITVYMSAQFRYNTTIRYQLTTGKSLKFVCQK